MELLPSEDTAEYSCDFKSFNAYNFIHTGNDLMYIYTYIYTDRIGSTTIQRIICKDRIMVLATHDMGVMKMGNIVPRAGIEPTSLHSYTMEAP